MTLAALAMGTFFGCPNWGVATWNHGLTFLDEMSCPEGKDRLRGLRILLAEDNDDAREILQFALTLRGAIVFAASNGAEAIPILLQERPDAVVTDMSMPFADGMVVLEAAREILGPVPCFAVTAFALVAERDAALEAGFDAHFGKPVDYGALADAIADVLARRPARTSEPRARGLAGVVQAPKKKNRAR